MMKVDLIEYTPNALELLIYTKSGRLKTGFSYEDVKKMNAAEKQEQLDYMMSTIKGSFEFVNYVFDISGVSRAFTHQLVRTRHASYQQETMRAVDVRNNGYLKSEAGGVHYDVAIKDSVDAYSRMVDGGVPVQDARGVLPTAMHTSILMSVNLRTLAEMADLRLCKRTQGEYQDVFKLIVQEILRVHPWAEPLLKVYCVKTGLCAFPRYTKCPVKRFTIEISDSVKNNIEQAWVESTHVANPKPDKNGFTM